MKFVKCRTLSGSPYDHQQDCAGLRSQLKQGKIVDKPVESMRVAIRKTIFGEGAERMVRKFRFFDESSPHSPWDLSKIQPEFSHFSTLKFVAKESRFVDVSGAYADRMEYHREFMRTQAIASQMALKFNNALDSVFAEFGEPENKTFLANQPRIHFLSPMVVEVQDTNLGALAFLIEPMLDVAKYEKFNNNMGYVKGQKESINELADSLANLALDTVADQNDGLGAIEEGSEEEEEEEEEEGGDTDILNAFERSAPDANTKSFGLEPQDYPNAFSHYTYQMSKKALMVVDLQGVFTGSYSFFVGGLVLVYTYICIHDSAICDMTQSYVTGRVRV